MISDPSMLFKSMKDIKDQSKALTFILTVPFSSAHQKTEQQRSGTVRKEDYSILCNLTQTQQNSADKEITSSQVDPTK